MKSRLFILIFLCLIGFNTRAQWTTSGSNIYNSNTGNVGIGTSPSSAAKLHVYTPSGNTYLYLDKTGTSEGALVFVKGGAAQFYFKTDNDGTDDLKLTANGLSGEGDASPRLRIPFANKNLFLAESGGNVGIGTSTPAFRLDVNGALNCTAINVNGVPFSSGGAAWIMNGSNMYYSSGNVGLNKISPAYPLDVNGIVNCTGLYVNGLPFSSGGSAWAMNGSNMYYSSGSVGIGINNPDAKLAVNGQIHAQEVKVSTTVPGPDYVFEKSYSLLALDSLSDFIRNNKHLPEVPSAAEMKDQGIKLGEMNLLLLKKIEELTLYVLELKKENEKQNALIESLKNQK